jgi:hypothetical protein
MTTRSTLSRSCLTGFILREEIPLCGEPGDFARRRLPATDLFCQLCTLGDEVGRENPCSRRAIPCCRFWNSLRSSAREYWPKLLILQPDSRCKTEKCGQIPAKFPVTRELDLADASSVPTIKRLESKPGRLGAYKLDPSHHAFEGRFRASDGKEEAQAMTAAFERGRAVICTGTPRSLNLPCFESDKRGHR